MMKTSTQNSDLHGNVPDKSQTVLLLVDVINDLDFPGNAALLRQAPILGRNIAALQRRLRRAGIPTIYVNDNKHRWRSDFGAVLQYCLRRGSPGRAFVKTLAPHRSDYIILKPKHSAFYATPLETILSYIHAKTVILAGLTTNACILSTAVELYMRDYEVIVPSDCVYALNSGDHERALTVMKNSFGVRVLSSSEVRTWNLKC